MARRGCCIGRLLSFLFSIAIIAGIVLIFLGYDMYSDALDETPLAEKVALVQAEDTYTPMGKIDSDLLTAIVAVEDRRFYSHFGLDPKATVRAIVYNMKEMELAEGGSTITQQLAKNLYFTNEKVFARKVAEAFMAFNIERNYGKEEILELYLNVIYFGSGCYGVKEATETYFHKDPGDLSPEEAAMLAGIPKAPNVFNPLVDYETAVKRQKTVLKIVQEFET